MGKFLLFAYEDGAARGGVRDYVGQYDNMPDTMAAMKTMGVGLTHHVNGEISVHGPRNAQIVDAESMEIILKCRYTKDYGDETNYSWQIML